MEYFVEFDRQIARNTVASVGFYYRTNERLIGNRNLLVPMKTYTPIQVTERNSGRQVTVYNQDPGAARQVRRALGQFLRAGHHL